MWPWPSQGRMVAESQKLSGVGLQVIRTEQGELQMSELILNGGLGTTPWTAEATGPKLGPSRSRNFSHLQGKPSNWLFTKEQQKNPGHSKHFANMNCYMKLKYLSILFYKVTTSISVTTDNLPGLKDYTVGHREAKQKSETKPRLNPLRPHGRQHSSMWRQRLPAHATQDNETHKLST